MVDRFQEDDRPPIIAGHCSVCHDEIQQGYEKHCAYCDEMVCEDCQRECWSCQTKGCEWCITKKDASGEWICEICKSNQEWLIEQARNGFEIQGYWYASLEETDDQFVLEYIHNEYPKISIHIAKVKK